MTHYPGKREPVPDPSDASQGTVATMDRTQSLGPGGELLLQKPCIRRCTKAGNPGS